MRKIEEGYIKGSTSFITKEKTELIIDQMKNCVCQVVGNKIGTGFFCKIPHKDKLIPVLITNYHIIDDNFLNRNKKLNLLLDEKKVCLQLSINKSRKFYSSKEDESDIMILNIKEEDEINNYLELDENLFKKIQKYHMKTVQYIFCIILMQIKSQYLMVLDLKKKKIMILYINVTQNLVPLEDRS